MRLVLAYGPLLSCYRGALKMILGGGADEPQAARDERGHSGDRRDPTSGANPDAVLRTLLRVSPERRSQRDRSRSPKGGLVTNADAFVNKSG